MRHWILFLFIQMPLSLLAQSTDSSATTAAVPDSTNRVVIRCLSTAVEEPLYVVDGVIWQPAEVRQLNLNRIKSISILKDPSAGAIFCRSARGGVIVIELTPAPDTVFQIRCARNGQALCGVTAILKPVGVPEDSLVLRSDESGFIHSSALTRGMEYQVELRKMGYHSSTAQWRPGMAIQTLSLEPEFRELDNVVVRAMGKIRCRLILVCSLQTNSIVSETTYPSNSHGGSTDGFGVYPNPVQRGGVINISLPEMKVGRWQLQLYSISGQLVQTQQLSKAVGSIRQQIPVAAAIPAGSYLLRLQGPTGERMSEKIIVQ